MTSQETVWPVPGGNIPLLEVDQSPSLDDCLTIMEAMGVI
jgi:hypothetical protein